MRAAVLTAFGSSEYGTLNDPSPSDGKNLVTVDAAGIHPIDLLLATGAISKPPLPLVVGREGVGRMDGRRVYFSAAGQPYGSMAELSLADPKAVFDVPDEISDGIALAMGIAGLTAWLSLTARAKMQPGETVLALGASGTLGMIPVQAARLLGAGGSGYEPAGKDDRRTGRLPIALALRP